MKIPPIKPKINDIYRRHHGKIVFVENLGHGCYFSLVFLQGHGGYTYIAGALAVGVLLQLFVSGDDHAK